MLEDARKKIHLASRLIEIITRKVNVRGLSTEQSMWNLTHQRVVAIRLTDKDIIEAEKFRIIPQKLYKFYLDDRGQIIRVDDRAIDADVLMYV